MYPGQTYVRHVMVLDRREVLSRSDLAVMLHSAQGSPTVNYAMNFSDVAQDAPYAEAVRWAASERLMSGCGDGGFGPDGPVTREQLAIILWRQSGRHRRHIAASSSLTGVRPPAPSSLLCTACARLLCSATAFGHTIFDCCRHVCGQLSGQR